MLDIPKYNRKILETDAKMIPLTRIILIIDLYVVFSSIFPTACQLIVNQHSLSKRKIFDTEARLIPLSRIILLNDLYVVAPSIFPTISMSTNSEINSLF
jgi:hypothetical protein